jgi:excisionase family DNA binding protein
MTSEAVPAEQPGTVVDEVRIRDRTVETGMWNELAPSEKLLTKGEVAQLCRVEIRTVDRWVAAGKIRCYRIPSGRLLFRKRDVLLALIDGRNA